jgi:hypothetical protein
MWIAGIEANCESWGGLAITMVSLHQSLDSVSHAGLVKQRRLAQFEPTVADYCSYFGFDTRVHFDGEIRDELPLRRARHILHPVPLLQARGLNLRDLA